jgi:hypothetical protein
MGPTAAAQLGVISRGSHPLQLICAHYPNLRTAPHRKPGGVSVAVGVKQPLDSRPARGPNTGVGNREREIGSTAFARDLIGWMRFAHRTGKNRGSSRSAGSLRAM